MILGLITAEVIEQEYGIPFWESQAHLPSRICGRLGHKIKKMYKVVRKNIREQEQREQLQCNSET